MLKNNVELKLWSVENGEFLFGSKKEFPNFIIKGCYVKNTKYENVIFELETRDIDSIENFKNFVVPESEPVVKNYCISLSIDTKFLKQFKADLKDGDCLNCSIELRKVSSFQGKKYVKCYLMAYKKVEPPKITIDMSFLD